MDEALRRAAAHVLVADVAAPVLDDGAAHHLRRVLAPPRRRRRHGDRRCRRVASVPADVRTGSIPTATSR